MHETQRPVPSGMRFPIERGDSRLRWIAIEGELLCVPALQFRWALDLESLTLLLREALLDLGDQGCGSKSQRPRDHEDLVQRWMTLSAFKHGYVDGMKIASRSQCFLSHSSFGAMSPNHLAEWFCCKSPRALHDAES